MKTLDAKVVILGAQGVGKTSITIRYAENRFNSRVNPTIGASFFTFRINVGDTKVKLQVWDTAGQERFHSMAPMYYRNADAALVVYDITTYDTFAAAKTWVRELRRNVDRPVKIFLVGNKSDLTGARNVNSDEVNSYGGKIGAPCVETSALTGEGIEDLFTRLGVAIADDGGVDKFPRKDPQLSPGLVLHGIAHGEDAGSGWCC